MYSKNSVALVISVWDGFCCERPFIYPLQISVGVGPFISIPFASLSSSSKDLYCKCPIQACQIAIVEAVTQLTIAGFGVSVNRITYWFSIILAKPNTSLSTTISDDWLAFLKKTSILFQAKGMLLNKLWPSSASELTLVTVKMGMLLSWSLNLKSTLP